MWGELVTSKVGSFECVLSRVAGSAKNGTGRGRTWKVRPSLCGIPRDSSASSRCVVLGRLCLWRGWNPQRKSIGIEKLRNSTGLQEVFVGTIQGRLCLWCGWNGKLQNSVSTERTTARRFPMGLHMNKIRCRVAK